MTKQLTHGWRLLLTLVLAIAAITPFASSASADPGTSIPISDVGSGMWSGNDSSAKLGTSIVNIGDVNGDGKSDLVATESGFGSTSPSRGAWVLFTQTGSQSLDDLPASDGYRIRITNTTLSITSIAAAGDQNGDGVPDVLIRRGNDVYVVYGVADPADDLPKCDPAGTADTRCLDVPSLEDVNGNRLGFALTSGQTNDRFAWSSAVGDFSGSGTDELAIGAAASSVIDANRGAIYVIQTPLGDQCSGVDGLCTVDISTLPTPDVIRIDGPIASAGFGTSVASAGDVNGDHRDDLLASVLASGTVPNSTYVVFGQNWDTSPVSTESMTPSTGYVLDTGSSLVAAAVDAGDANGDGLADPGIFELSLTADSAVAVPYSPATIPSSTVPINPPDPGEGYILQSSDTDEIGQVLAGVGDLNSDGLDDMVVANQAATIGGVANSGDATILLGQGDNPTSPITLGPDMTPSQGFSLVGDATFSRIGSSVVSLGDLDGDGIPDMAVGAPNAAGEIVLVLSTSLYGSATTGQAGNVSTNGATLGGSANPNGRDSQAYFEYGKTASYGKQTSPTSVGDNHQTKSVGINVSGLSAKTKYHYRIVVKNNLGLASYGQDQTFTTSATPPSCTSAQECCQQDPSASGCGGPNPPQTHSLGALVAAPKNSKVKRGKKTVVTTTITSTGNQPVNGLKICMKAPKKKIHGAKCIKVGSLGAGKTATKNFKVKVKKKAKKGNKISLKFTATNSSGAGKRTAKAKIKVVK